MCSATVSVSATGDQTALSGIMRLVAAAQASASRAQALADRAAAILFYVALGAGAVTLALWWLQGDREGALVRTATVLVIACPHALGLAIPLVIAISTSLGARNGLLIKDRLALERARTLDTVIFDKTGTLTRGEPALVDGAHELDAATRTLDLDGVGGVRRTDRRARGALHTGEEIVVLGSVVAAKLGLAPIDRRRWDPVLLHATDYTARRRNRFCSARPRCAGGLGSSSP